MLQVHSTTDLHAKETSFSPSSKGLSSSPPPFLPKKKDNPSTPNAPAVMICHTPTLATPPHPHPTHHHIAVIQF